VAPKAQGASAEIKEHEAQNDSSDCSCKEPMYSDLFSASKTKPQLSCIGKVTFVSVVSYMRAPTFLIRILLPLPSKNENQLLVRFEGLKFDSEVEHLTRLVATCFNLNKRVT
jgi:hypothetical protein